MKKKLTALGLLIAALAALIAGLLAMGDNQAPIAEPPHGDAEYVYRHGSPPYSILIEGPGREPYTLVRTQLDTEKNMADGSTIPGWESLPLDTARINGVLNASKGLACIETVLESTHNYAVFGLDSPRAKVTLDFGEEGVKSLLIGDVAPGNIGVYVRIADEPPIYLCPVYTLDSFLLSSADYLSRSVTPPAGLPMDFTTMTLGGGAREEAGEIVVAASSAEEDFRLLAPINHEINTYTATGVMMSVFGIQASGIAAVEPTPFELDALGFSEPWASVRVAGGNQGSFTLFATRPDEGGTVLLYREGIPVIYTAMAEELHWLDAQFYDLMSPFALSPLLRDLTGVDILSGGKVYSFAINAQGDELSVTLDGEPIDFGSFERFFATLTSAALEYTSTQPEGAAPEAEARFIYRYRSGEEHSVAFYPADIPLRHLIRVDEGRWFLTRSSYLARALGDLDKVVAGEDVDVYYYSG